MKDVVNVFLIEILRTIKKPKRILGIFNKNKLNAFSYNLESKWKYGEKWTNYDSNQIFQKRVYNKYEDYIEHQKSKIEHIAANLDNYDIEYRKSLRMRLENEKVICNGMIVLCLAARIGTEVKSFLDLGCFAVGIDLNPGKGNKYVLHGDFHYLQFPSNIVDIVFTNSLDHALDIKKLIGEVRRVLKPNGFFVLDAIKGSEDGAILGSYETFSWSKLDDIISLFEEEQFKIKKRSEFEYPWKGEHLYFQKI